MQIAFAGLARALLLTKPSKSRTVAPLVRHCTKMTNPTGDPKRGLQFPAVKGRFVRKDSSFRDWIKADGSTPFKPELDRYHLYVSLACPWAHRTLITRALKGLQHVFPVTVVHHYMGEKGWRFVNENEEDVPPLCKPEPNYGVKQLSELYFMTDENYDGRYTVPVLWCKKSKRIVNNESSEIIKMLNCELNDLAKHPEVDLYPNDMRSSIDDMAQSFYNALNNGVYRCGFAKSQEAYDEAIGELTKCIDSLEDHLSKSRYLLGDKLTLADVRLFPTLIRFDPVYITHFKTNTRKIQDLPALSGYMREIYQIPAVKETVNMEHIKKHYFGSHHFINPYSIVPQGPDMSYLEIPHGRDSM